MSKRYQFAEGAPKWITSSDSPFRQETREHLDRVARNDPHVFELVARIQAKSSGEGSLERVWARNICSGNIQAFTALPEKFPNEQDLNDVLRLAAYRSDNSYAYFFRNYGNTMDDAARKRCDEVTRMIAPVICELQPQVAVGFAGYIIDAFERGGKLPEAEKLFTDLAQANPLRIQYQRDRFTKHPLGEKILATARASDQTPRNAVEAGMVEAIRMQDELAKMGRKF